MKNLYIETYDKTDKYSIEEYGQKMVGHTFNDVCKFNHNDKFLREEEVEYVAAHENKARKGGLGELIEEQFFHYKANSDSAPDFKEAGVELKTTPYKINKNGSKSAKERLVLTMIDYNAVANEADFNSSHFWYKSKEILLVYYLWEQEIKNRMDYRIDYVRLFTPSEDDLIIIKDDYNKIVKKIQDGEAHELSESDTMYLSACTKSLDSSVTRSQPYSDIPAKPRAFAYKTSYMTYVLNNYIIGNKPKYESIKKVNTLQSFEDFIISSININAGKTVDNLCSEYSIDVTKSPKNLGAMLAFRMLGIKGNNAEEFIKANIQIKTIRVQASGKIKESMSFPTFKFTEIVKQEWEDSDLYELLSSTKFLFVIYQENSSGEYILDRAMFWNMPYDDLNGEVRVVWEKTKAAIINGLEITRVGNNYTNNLPKMKENRVCHVRPHARDSKDTYPLPDGREYPKQCFWLNNSYILSIIKK